MKALGLQLFSIKEECEADLMKALEDVRKMGYETVEFAGYYGHKPEDLKETLDRLGLKAISAHVRLELLKDHLEEEIQALKTLGAKYIVCPWAEIKTIEDAKEYALVFNEIGKKCLEEGLVFAYHNHAHELNKDKGQYPLEALFDNVDSRYVKQQIDIYWLAYGGIDPVDYLHEHGDRIVMTHLKQIKSQEEAVNVKAADGIIPFHQIIETFPDMEFIYEQEAFIGDRLEEVKHSCQFIMKE